MKKAYFAFVVLELLFSCSTQEEQAPVIEVQSITIEQNDLTLEEGESMILSAKVLPEDAENKTIKWSSSDESKVMVSSSGKIVAMAIGQSVITAEAGKKSDFITVTVVAKAIPVTGISLTPSSLTIKVSESHTIEAEITPDNATNKNVFWTSSNPEVASVENGIVMGLKPGSVTITAKTDDGGKTAECSVTVKPNLAPSVTVGSSHISAVCAVLSGDANLETTMSADMTMGIMISTNSGVLPSNSTKIVATDISAKQGFDSSYSYSVNATGLEPNSTYYFRSYVTQSGQDTYGETMEFKTKELSSMIHTLDASAITAVCAQLNASFDLTDVIYSSKSFGYYWGDASGSLIKSITASEGNGSLFASLSILKPSQEYFFQACLVLDGKEFKDVVISFTTEDIKSLLATKDADEIEPTCARLNAKLNLENVVFETLTYGYYWGDSEQAQNTFIEGTEIVDHLYSCSINNLSHKTQYWFKAYLKIDNQEYYGDLKSFSTGVVPVESISLDKSEIIINTIGESITLQPTVLPEDATNKSIVWSTDKESVATVDDNGTIKAISNGAATITATTVDQEKKAVCVVTVAQYVTGITLDNSSITLNEGEIQTITATVAPSYAYDQSITWSSSNTNVATVDDQGVITAVSKGYATITATASDGSGVNVKCSVTVNRLVSSITLSESSISIYKGKTTTLTATVIPSSANNTSVTWQSSNTAVATVTNAGVVKGLSRGNATITVTANDGSGIQATCDVEVKQYVTSITLDKTSISLNEGEEETLTFTALPDNANDKTVSWSSSDESIAKVDVSSGTVTAVSKGTASIKATANDGSGKTASCQITVIRLVSYISFDKTSLTVYNGKTESITATVSPSDASMTDLTWTSSNKAITTVSNTGVVTGVSRGNVTITATAKDGSGISENCEVEVKQYVTYIGIGVTNVALNVGEAGTVWVNYIEPEDANDKSYTWSSSDESVATVDSNGKVVAKKIGKANIIATANDGSGVSDSCPVIVKHPTPAGAVNLGLSVDWASCNLGENGFVSSPEEYGAYYAWGETETKTRFSYNNYKWGYGDNGTLTKYNYDSSKGVVDNKTILETGPYGDDAASKKLGGNWRMPTESEWAELYWQCTWEWVTLNGVQGAKATSKKNGNSIFFPASGWMDLTTLRNAGEEGTYWTSELHPDNPSWAINFNVGPSYPYSGFNYRNAGFTIRPVTD